MADEPTVTALNVRGMHFLISRSLASVFETNNMTFIRYWNENEAIKSRLTVFFNKRPIMVPKYIVQVGRQIKIQSQQKAIYLRMMIEKFPGKCCILLSILVSSITFQFKKE